MRHRQSISTALLRLVLLLAVALAAVPASTRAHAAATQLLLKVTSARTEPRAFDGAGVTRGDPITRYKFIINQDNVGDPNQARNPDCAPSDPAYPANCNWPSIRAQNGFAPIVAQGDESDLNQTAGLDLPPGNYLISVTADGYKLDGAWFSIPLQGSAPVEVQLQPLPLPTATIRVRVFEDNAIVNGAPDVPAEHGLQGFRASVNDIFGEVTTDVFGNPLCTQYELDPQGQPDPTRPIPGTGGGCYSDANGDIVIPNLGPNRYAVSAVPPNGTDWVQTTTLEGNKDWDTWVQEGATGYDTEFNVAGEPFPFTIFGFVRPTALQGSGNNEIKGVVAAAKVYVPYNGGLPYNGGVWGGLSGAKIDRPIERPWIALNALNNGDRAIYVGRGNPDGSFDIQNVPDGTYTLTYWDDQLNNLLDLVNVSVRGGQVVDTGVLFLTGWFTRVEGRVCNDLNSNGKCEPGEPGLPNFSIAVKRRTNSLMDRGATLMVTDPQGRYVLENVYPLTQWIILEAYNDRFYTTGYTYQTDNQPNETTILGNGVDVNLLPIIGQSGRLDWAVRPYDATGRNGGPRNGGIVGTVSYDTTRNELDPRYAAVENWQVGIPSLTVNLYAPIPCTPGSADCVQIPGSIAYYKANPDGSLAKGPLLNSTTTESWQRPKDCQARDVDGNPVDQQVLPPSSGGYDCLEAPLMGVQFSNDFATVDGNYGFTEILADPVTGQPLAQPQPIAAGDYLVEVEIPRDSFGKPIYQVTREEDINVFSGNQYTPQIPPPPCAGPLHTVDVAGVGTDGPDAVFNPTFAEQGGSPYEGQQRPLCTAKLVTVSNGRSTAPGFNLFTDVPIPGRYFGYIVDDLNLSTNPQDLLFGEKAGVPNAAIGIYDYSNRLIKTINSDPNGIFEVLLPSTETVNCPSPSGVCANLYRLVGNDPGVPGRLNPNFNPQFRTIAATFEVFPGDIIPADLAPTQIGVSIQAPGSQFNGAVSCRLDDAQPQLFAVSRPYVNRTGSFTITGLGFGASQGSGQVTLDGTPLPVTSWSDRQISVTVPNTLPGGPHQLQITASNGQRTINGLTFHIIGKNDYEPKVFEVGPGKPYSTIQSALDAAAKSKRALVVVYPGGVPDSSNPSYNPQKAYFENLIMTGAVKLQGVGPGGVYNDGTVVDGSIIDGAAFGGDTQLANAWRARVAELQWDGNQNVYEGAVITILAKNGAFSANYRGTIDGFAIQGGDQQGFPNNINQIGGTRIPGAQPNVTTQGGGIFANAYVRYLQITNNILRSNGGAYGGAIRLGTPDLAGSLNDNQNENALIANNQIIANGGTNLAGAIGIFAGADGYEVAYNNLCGNFSAEYGGAISHYGRSPNGKIHHNRIYFNRSYDEGGAVMIAGELPANPSDLSPGAGPVDIYNNVIQSNLANDDGGGIRFLMAGNFPFNVYNNMIVNNISTHEGGGIAIDDAPDVRIFNNTIMKNITTATAATSNGQPAPAGLSTASNSAPLQATLPASAPLFSKPLLFNNIFWDNRAGRWSGGGVAGIGQPGDPNPINYWDLGVADGSGTLDPTNSLLQVGPDGAGDASNRVGTGFDPRVVATYDTSVAVFPWRTNPGIVGAAIVAVDLPPNLMGDYHLQNGSSAIDLGVTSKSAVSAPARDIDDQYRPGGTAFDSGADEFGASMQAAFPTTPVLDTFNRGNGGTNMGANWRGDVDESIFRIYNNQVQVRKSGTMYWRQTTFGANQEAFLTFTKLVPTANSQGLLLKVSGLRNNRITATSSLIAVYYDATTGSVFVTTQAPGQGSVTRATLSGVTFADGDTLGARALANGTVTVYKNGVEIGSTSVVSGPSPWPAANAAGGGYIGVYYRAPSFAVPNDAHFDNFGGGTLP